MLRISEVKIRFSFHANMADNKKKPDLGLLEEDDEFEEFPAEGSNNTLSSFYVYPINAVYVNRYSC